MGDVDRALSRPRQILGVQPAEILGHAIRHPVAWEPRNEHVAAQPGKVVREKIELLRTIGEAMEQDDDTFRPGAHGDEARMTLGIDFRAISGAERIETSDRVGVAEGRPGGGGPGDGREPAEQEPEDGKSAAGREDPRRSMESASTPRAAHPMGAGLIAMDTGSLSVTFIFCPAGSTI